MHSELSLWAQMSAASHGSMGRPASGHWSATPSLIGAPGDHSSSASLVSFLSTRWASPLYSLAMRNNACCTSKSSCSKARARASLRSRRHNASSRPSRSPSNAESLIPFV